MDIKIDNLKKHIFGIKTESLRLARANEILSQNMVITEKVDGTKLTLVRTQQVDKTDYTKNWVVAYKGTVLYAKEFAHLGDKEKGDISQSYVAIGQYSMIFDHLAKINNKINSIPKSTEFSVEFAQNKDTLTRTYVNTGGLFLRSYGEVRYLFIGGDLQTIPKQEITDYESVKKMAELLEIASFPIFFQGKLSKENLLKNPLFGSKLTNVDWTNPLDVVSKFSDAILEVPSILGGTTEGVVMKLDNGDFFKLVQADQYDDGVRDAKKDMHRLTLDDKTPYFQQIRELIYKVFDKIGTEGKSEEDIISDVNFYVAKNQPKLKKFFDALQKIAGDKKNIVQIKDDIHDTTRLLVSKKKLLGTTTKTIGLVPIAGKPIQIGHWRLIEKAARESDTVVVYTSTTDRGEKSDFKIQGKDFIKIWHDIFIPHLPKNVKVKFTDSPVLAARHEAKHFEMIFKLDKAEVPNVNLYSGADDVHINFPDKFLEDDCPSLLAAGKIKKVGLERKSKESVDIKGIIMRGFLRDNDKKSFFEFLPPVSDDEKEEIWNTLIKNKPKVNETNPYANFAEEVINEIYKEHYILLTEAMGTSKAMYQVKDENGDPVLNEKGKPIFANKKFNGGDAAATTKLKILDDNDSNIHSQVRDDVKEFAINLNDKFGFWEKNNPYIESGLMFNGSSRHLMDPEKIGKLKKVKPSFGDIDVIIPNKFVDKENGVLTKYLDKIDDGLENWKPTSKNKISNKFHYVGRPQSASALENQLVTLWYYIPKNQIVQFDFEGDAKMKKDSTGFLKPSRWMTYSKSSPWEDLEAGIKGMAHKVLLRALARGVTVLENSVVLTGTGIKNINAAISARKPIELTPKDISDSLKHALPGMYIYNTGSGRTAGGRVGYIEVSSPYGIKFNGKPTKAYRWVEASETPDEEIIQDVDEMFKIFFRKTRLPDAKEQGDMDSYLGLLRLMKANLDRKTNETVAKRFSELIIEDTTITDQEKQAILTKIPEMLGISI